MSKKLSKSSCWFYGIGVAYFILDQVFNQWVQYFYLPPEKAIQDYGITSLLQPKYLVIAFIVMRLVDAIADPVVGYLSDNSKSKFGRRSIFMLIGIIPLSISMVLFFYPIGSSPILITAYLAVIGSIYFTAYTLVGGPYNALVADLGSNKEERLKLSTVQSIFRLIFTAIPLVFSTKILTWLISKNGSFNESMRIMVIGFSLISAILVLISIFGLKESQISSLPEEKEQVKFIDSIAFLKKKEIMLYFLGFFFFFSGFNIIRNSVIFYVVQVLGKTEGFAMIPTAILFLIAAVFFPVTQYWCKKYNYRTIMLLDLVLIILGTLGLVFLGSSNMIIFYLMFIIIGIGVSGSAFIFPPAMLSEISNNISEKYKVRIEGMMFGIQGLFLKLALLVQLVSTTLLLTLGSKVGGTTTLGVNVTLILAVVFLIISYICYYLKKNEI